MWPALRTTLSIQQILNSTHVEGLNEGMNGDDFCHSTVEDMKARRHEIQWLVIIQPVSA